MRMNYLNYILCHIAAVCTRLYIKTQLGLNLHYINILTFKPNEFMTYYTVLFIIYEIFVYVNKVRMTYRDYFMVGERVRFLFTSRLLQANE